MQYDSGDVHDEKLKKIQLILCVFVQMGNKYIGG